LIDGPEVALLSIKALHGQAHFPVPCPVYLCSFCCPDSIAEALLVWPEEGQAGWVGEGVGVGALIE